MAAAPLIVPTRFAEHTVEVFGAEGAAWIAALPALVAELARQWDLAIGSPFVLSYDYVVAARRADGTEAVLKVGVPRDELLRGITALRLYGGDGICRLLAADEERHAMLLERLRPGEMLVELARADDEAATRVGAAVMRHLWRPLPDGAAAKPIAEWFHDAFARYRAEHGAAGPLPAPLLARAEALARELLDSAPADLLLHGDFHHYNVLSAQRAPWLAIDPKGMRGDPGYEAGPFLLNPDLGGAERQPAVLRRRLDVLAEELSYDRARLRDWAFAHALLSACWSAEDEGHGWDGALATAETLLAL